MVCKTRVDKNTMKWEKVNGTKDHAMEIPGVGCTLKTIETGSSNRPGSADSVSVNMVFIPNVRLKEVTNGEYDFEKIPAKKRPMPGQSQRG